MSWFSLSCCGFPIRARRREFIAPCIPDTCGILPKSEEVTRSRGHRPVGQLERLLDYPRSSIGHKWSDLLSFQRKLPQPAKVSTATAAECRGQPTGSVRAHSHGKGSSLKNWRELSCFTRM